MVASGELIASYDSGEMVRQARILAQSTAELIQAIKGEAETQSDSDLQVRIFGYFYKHGTLGVESTSTFWASMWGGFFGSFKRVKISYIVIEF